jgi:hypothetical protein
MQLPPMNIAAAVPEPGAAAPESDAFVDALFEKLDTSRQKAATQATMASESRERVMLAARAWWEEFHQVVERKVGAWNAKAAPDARVTFTRSPAGPIKIFHRTVEAELALKEVRVVMTGRIGPTRPRESPFIDFSEARGGVGAILSGEGTAQSPNAAADHLLGPILSHAFTGSAQ